MTSGNKESRKGKERSFILETFRKYATVKTFIFLALSAVVIAFMIKSVDLHTMGRSFASADPLWLAAAAALYAVSNLCKSIRYKIMIKSAGVTQGTMYAITSYQNFFNQILPARTGELTLIYYLKKAGGSSMTKGLHVLIVTRIYDLIIVAVFFLSSAILFWGSRINTGLIVLGCAALAASIASLFFLKWIILFCHRIFANISALVRFNRTTLYRKIDSKVEPIITEFSDYKTVKQLPSLVISSIAVWIVLYLFSFASIRAFHVDMGILQTIVGNTGQVLANVLPVNSFGSLGTLEAGWAGGFLLVGMNAQDAVTTAFGYHIINFVAAAFIALFCWGVMRLRKK
jgi:hypothetical protein